jgi:hypothetical protein
MLSLAWRRTARFFCSRRSKVRRYSLQVLPFVIEAQQQHGHVTEPCRHFPQAFHLSLGATPPCVCCLCDFCGLGIMVTRENVLIKGISEEYLSDVCGIMVHVYSLLRSRIPGRSQDKLQARKLMVAVAVWMEMT